MILYDIYRNRKRGRWGLVVASLVFFFTVNSVKAQEIHFTQYYSTPLSVNPANVGAEKKLRFANDYRNQWSKLGVPIRTYYTSLDKGFVAFDQRFGIGGSVIHDQSSLTGLTTDEFLISLSYSYFYRNHRFILGLQPVFANKSVDINSLTFASQFNSTSQTYDASLSNAEYGLTGGANYFDFNIGIGWRTMIHNIVPSAGISLSHIFRPEVTFSTASSTAHLPIKFMFNSQVTVPLNYKFDITPYVLFSSVSGTNELLTGAIGGYNLDDFFIAVKKVYATAMFRSNLFTDIDAFALGGGLKFPSFDLGITYDINISPLHNATNYNGAFEISIVFTRENGEKPRHEPCIVY